MGRFVNVAGIAVALTAAAAVYHVKYEASQASQQVSELQREIKRERDTIAILRAEWSYLNDPHRLQTLAEQYLQIRPVAARQIVTADQIPERPLQLNPLPGGDDVEPLPLASEPWLGDGIAGLARRSMQ